MEANEYQIGGDHYRSEYQHWDFVYDADLNYLLACATKYISRWRKKNGLEDLRKALHYITKAEELGIYPKLYKDNPFIRFIKTTITGKTIAHYGIYWDRFSSNLVDIDSSILHLIFIGDYNRARALISDLIDEVECGPGPNYIKG